MWRREMKWLLCVSDHIVEMTLTWQTFLDGTNLRLISDIYINLPALRKLDNMLLSLLEVLDVSLTRQRFGMSIKEL
ncbi:unnamed protein product [Brassica oleracea var. botrytis]|uniref:BnaCnng31880D protein n=3 Tax=Brassica TaxID=3705 RepID=A0A078IYP1_BRANA|nr:hypothetical protein HID58_085789 [Brassica napus]CAF1723520.1 unnamed protein product [Brassica napus]CDY57376.1 BnaCnng31880D [Brassica napus]VDD29635.1 unnamed protein product [Brassica oleracea]